MAGHPGWVLLLCRGRVACWHRHHRAAGMQMPAAWTKTDGHSSPLSPRLRLAAARYRFRQSLFRLPALLVVGDVLLAEFMATLHRSVHAALHVCMSACEWRAVSSGGPLSSVGVQASRKQRLMPGPTPKAWRVGVAVVVFAGASALRLSCGRQSSITDREPGLALIGRTAHARRHVSYLLPAPTGGGMATWLPDLIAIGGRVAHTAR
jgi:hypothetical protein